MLLSLVSRGNSRSSNGVSRRHSREDGCASRMRGHSSNSSAGENDIRMRNNRSGSQPESPPPSPSPSTGETRGCCFCWCCNTCHPAACITVKSPEESTERSNEKNIGPTSDGGDSLTLEEIKSWAESFDKLMKSGRKVFRDFLRLEYSEENLLFWLACEELKKENSADVVEEKARIIYEDYISILSPKEVSLDSRVREVINSNMVEPTPNTFDEAQLQIYTLMHRDSYPRFLNSQTYKRLMQQEELS